MYMPFSEEGISFDVVSSGREWNEVVMCGCFGRIYCTQTVRISIGKSALFIEVPLKVSTVIRQLGHHGAEKSGLCRDMSSILRLQVWYLG